MLRKLIKILHKFAQGRSNSAPPESLNQSSLELDINPILPQELSEPDRLSALSQDLLKHIGSFLDPQNNARLRGTAHIFNKLSNGQGLLQAVVNGDIKTVKIILDNKILDNRDLLLHSYRATDYSGRRIHQKVYPAALAAENEDMAKIIKEKLLKYYGNNSVKEQQGTLFSEQENEEWEKRKEIDIAALDAVVKVIEQADVKSEDNRDALMRFDDVEKWGDILILDAQAEQAIVDFRKHLDSCKDEPITTGRHWNVELLQRAFELYEEKYVQLGGATSPRNMLFWRQVIGYIERYAPANYAQAFAQSIYWLATGEETLELLNTYNGYNSFRFCKGQDGSYYFPLDADPTFRLGYECAVWNIGAKSNSIPLEERINGQELEQGPRSRIFNMFVTQKTEKLQRLCNEMGEQDGQNMRVEDARFV